MIINKEQIKRGNYAYSTKYNYVIKWNAKCGCTLLRRLFYELHKDEQKVITKEWESGLPSFKYNIHKFPVSHSFLLTRNPYKRVVSMFTNKYNGPNNIDNLQKKFKLNTNNFYSFVLKLKEFKNNNTWCDIHLTPQYFNYEQNDILIKLENIKNRSIELYSNLKKIKPLKNNVINFFNKPDIGFINETNKNNNSVFIGYNIYANNFNGPWPDYKYFYDEKIKKLVYEIYKDDFTLFNYKYDSI
jgi:hypothetical protein